MADAVVTLVEVLRIALGSLVLAIFLWLVWEVVRLGPDLVMTRAMLQLKRSLRIAVVLTLGILFQLASTGVELYGHVSGGLSESAELINQGIDALTLLLFFAALVLFIPIVRVPSTAVHLSKQA